MTDPMRFFSASIMIVNFFRPSFWGQRTKMEKRLMLAAGVTSVLAIAFFAAFIATLLVRTSADINGKYSKDQRLEWRVRCRSRVGDL